jgi:hypothetical protein
MQLEWDRAHIVSEELAEGPPSRRANATLTACPSGNHLWCIGGEFFSEDGKAVRSAYMALWQYCWITKTPIHSIFTTTCSGTALKRMNGGNLSRQRAQVHVRPTQSQRLPWEEESSSCLVSLDCCHSSFL